MDQVRRGTSPQEPGKPSTHPSNGPGGPEKEPPSRAVETPEVARHESPTPAHADPSRYHFFKSPIRRLLTHAQIAFQCRLELLGYGSATGRLLRGDQELRAQAVISRHSAALFDMEAAIAEMVHVDPIVVDDGFSRLYGMIQRIGEPDLGPTRAAGAGLTPLERELAKACEALLPYVEQQVRHGQVEGEDTSHYGDARAVQAARAVLEKVKACQAAADGVRRSIEAANRRARVGAPVTDPSRPAMQPGHQAAMQGGAA